jgi:outer membrane immunogenic protein
MSTILRWIMVAGITSAGCAQAADIAPLNAPPPAVASTQSWAGFYLGGHFGWGQSQATWSGLDALGNPAAFASSGSGALAGGQFGHNWQSGRFVFGVEADASAFDIKRGGPCQQPQCGGKAIESFTGRAGIVVDHTLFYLKGGAASMQ